MFSKLPLILLLLVSNGCVMTHEQEEAAGVPGPEAREAHERHSREDSAWLGFDAQLERLHEQRIRMRELYDLPEIAPGGEGETGAQAWQFCLAAHRSQLAGMRAQEALNDLEHCRQALVLAAQRVEVGNVERGLAQEVMWAALAKLKEKAQLGDKRQNLLALDHFAGGLPDYYRDLLHSLTESF